MAIRFDIKWTAHGYDFRDGTMDWGAVSRQFDSREQLQGVKLGADIGVNKKLVVSPSWPKNGKDWSVFKADIVSVNVDDPQPPDDGGDVQIPSEVVLNWRDEAGTLIATQTYAKKVE
jgi:hypothetical protein